MRTSLCMLISLVTASAGVVRAEEPKAEPLPVPLTRLELKRSLEDLKDRTPRIPLPELTESDKTALGERGRSYEGRLRYHYMPAAEGRGGGFGAFGFSREPDPNATLSYEFKTMLFWIVSRTNNCHY